MDALRYLIATIDERKLGRRPKIGGGAVGEEKLAPRPWLRVDNEALWTTGGTAEGLPSCPGSAWARASAKLCFAFRRPRDSCAHFRGDSAVLNSAYSDWPWGIARSGLRESACPSRGWARGKGIILRRWLGSLIAASRFSRLNRRVTFRGF